MIQVCDKCDGFGKLKKQRCKHCGQTLICDKCKGLGWIKHEM